jgi:hypothetical protein
MWDCLHSCVTLQILFHSDVMCWDNFGLDLELGTALDRLVDDFGWLCNHLVAVDTVSSRGVRMLTLSLLVLCFTFGRCYWFCTEVVLGQWWFNLVKGLSVRTQWKGRIWGLLTKFVKFVFNICRLWLDLKPCWIWWDASFERGCGLSKAPSWLLGQWFIGDSVWLLLDLGLTLGHRSEMLMWEST